jgi:hypothetical protein
MLVVSESCQNYQNDAVINSLRDIYLCLSVSVFPYPSTEGEGENVMGLTMNLC